MYKVLLVDDEPRSLEGLQWVVDWADLGFEICGACENGEEAMAAMTAHNPDLVVTDIQMPVFSGLDLIHWARSSGNRDSRFVIVSAYNEFQYAQQAMRDGVSHYLLKPLIEEEVASVIRDVSRQLDTQTSKRMAKQATANGMEEEELFARESWNPSPNSPFEPSEEMGSILEALEGLEFERFGHLLDRMLRLWEERQDQPAAVRSFAEIIVLRCDSLLRTMGTSAPGDHVHQETDILPFPSNAATPDIVRTLRKFISTFMEKVGQTRDRIAHSILYDVKASIEASFARSLTIKEIAKTFYVNPVHLGQSFARKFGVGINEYIHDLRAEEAKRLLSLTDMALREVAETVGYTHYHHFLKQFVKRVHLKPAEYRGQAIPRSSLPSSSNPLS